MGMNETPSGERLHIAFFGKRNAGKSSLVNAITGQDLSVVSDVEGTTTDPVSKSMELLPIGPVLIIDTPGFDDEGELGALRVKKTKQILNKADVAILVIDATVGMSDCDKELLDLFEDKKIPYLKVWNKSDLIADDDLDGVVVSAKDQIGIWELKEKIGVLGNRGSNEKKLVADLVSPLDFVALVVPIDSAAPKGRLILPQQQMIRDLLEAGAISIVVRESELEETLSRLGHKPAMVITDSQAFSVVSEIVPQDVPLTSFSILMARYKGFLETAVKGVCAIDRLKDGDKVLISEGCTHHRQCDDIGTVKIPTWLKQYTGKNLIIETSSGIGFPEDLSEYALIIHCGGCMLNEREVLYRMNHAMDEGVPFTNYGIVIAYMKGILARSIELFPNLLELLNT